MIDSELLSKLCCPETHQPLRLAEPSLIESLNRKVASGELTNRAGQKIQEQFEAGLIREDGLYLYPVRRNIPIMLVSEAVPLSSGST